MTKDKWNLKQMTDQQLYEFIAGWKVNTEGYITGTEELRKRNEAPANKRAWFAIGISLLALIISFFSLLKDTKNNQEHLFELRWCPSDITSCDVQNGTYVKGGRFSQLDECTNSIKHLKFNKNNTSGECVEVSL